MKTLIIIAKKNWPVPLSMACAAFFVYYPITDADIFWHLAAGREMIARHAILHSDPFAFTLASPPWTDLHWLFQLLMYGLYKVGSYQALIAFKLVTVASVVALLCLTVRSRKAILSAALLSALLFYNIRYLLCIRPILISLLCMAIYLFLFEHARESGRKKPLWLCLPLQIIWTNSQGLYMIGLFIIGAYWVESIIRRLRDPDERPLTESAVLVLAAASCLFNPYGLAGLLLPFNLFSRIAPDVKNIYSLAISENVPLLSLTGYDAVYRVAVFATAIMAGALLFYNRKRARIAPLILFTGFLSLAFFAVRNVPLYVVAVIPIIAGNIDLAGLMGQPRRPRLFTRPMCLISGSLATVVLLFLIFRYASIAALYPPHQTISPFRFPEKIVGYLEEHPVPGAMFNDIRYGGYLIWRLYPQKQVFIDTRLIIRSPGFFADYLALSKHPDLFDRVAEKFDITQAILPSALFTLHRQLLRYLYESPRWHLEYTDGASVLFVRNDIVGRTRLDLSRESTAGAIADSISSQWYDAPAVRLEALGHFAELLDNLGLHEVAEKIKRQGR